MFPVADDFAAIAKRMKEIQAEVAKERAAAETRLQAEDKSQPETHQPETHAIYDDLTACA